MTKKTLNSVLAGAATLAAVGALNIAASDSAHAGTAEKEKCYGVVKAGMNGCGSADKAHGCAGQATEDASGVEWISLPAGICEKLAGGSLEPIFEDEAAHDGEHHDEEH